MLIPYPSIVYNKSIYIDGRINMAAYAIQFRRGNTTQHNSFTGLLGEVTVDTDKNTLVVHDGSTTGGFPLAREGAASNASSGSFTSNVTIGGTLAVTSTASFTDDVSITGDLGMTGHIIPSANITYDLGSTTHMWRDVYVGPGSLYVNGKKVIEDNNGSINFTTDTNETLKLVVPGATGTLQFSAGSLQLDGEINAITGDITFGDHLDMNSNRIKEVSAPVEGADAANKTYVDTAISSGLSGGTLAVDATTGDFSGDVAVGGSLTVTGTVTTVNSETIELADNILLLNSNALGNASQNAGLEVERGDDLNVQLLWDETNNRWTVSSEDFKAATFIGDLTGDVTGTVSSLANHDTADLVESATNRYFTPARESAITTAYQSYADQAEADAIGAAASDATTKANTVEATASADATAKANQALVDAKEYADTAVTAGSYSDSDVADYLSSGQAKLTTSLRPHQGGVMIGHPASPYGYIVGERLVAVEDFSIYDSNTSTYIKAIRNSGGQTFFHGQKYLPPQSGQTDLELEANSGGKINVNAFRVYNVGTPTDPTDATNKSYVDAEISTLSAAVTAGSYSDSDVASFLLAGTKQVGTVEGNIEISSNKVLTIFGRGPNKARIVYEAEMPGGADADFDLLGSAGTSNQFPTLRAYQFEPIDGQTDIILQPGGTGGNVMVRNRRIQQLANPSNPDDAANKSYVDTAEVDAKAYTDTRETAITTAYQSYVDTAVAGKDNTDEITEGSTNLYFTDARADARVANATGVNLSIASRDTDDLSEGTSNLYFTDARAVAAVESALTHFHSSEQEVTAAVATANATAAVSFTFSELVGADHYAVYLNRMLLRPGEFTVSSGSTNNLTISTGVLDADDELEVVGLKIT
jgi:hypothetical protein